MSKILASALYAAGGGRCFECDDGIYPHSLKSHLSFEQLSIASNFFSRIIHQALEVAAKDGVEAAIDWLRQYGKA